jgi:hypothetical protein
MHDQELRSRLQALAAAGRVAPDPAAFGAVRRRGRRKLQGATALVLVGLLAVVGGVRLASETFQRPGARPIVPVAPPAGPPAAVAPATFVGQVGDGDNRRTVIIDARTGRVVREVPGSARRSDVVGDVVVGPDLRSMYLPAAGSGPACDSRWTRLDLATGARQPAFGGLTGVGEFSLSADGRTLAYLHTTAPATLDWGSNRMRCHTELVVRELASGRQRVWTIPPGGSVQGLQLSPDATRLVYRLTRPSDGDTLLHLLPLAGTTSVTDGDDLPAAGDCGPTIGGSWTTGSSWPSPARAATAAAATTTSWPATTCRPGRWSQPSPSACPSSPSAWTWTRPAATSSSPSPASPTTSTRPPST